MFASVLTSGALAEVTLPAILSDHMVLRRAARVPLWGKATPGEEVSISMNGQTAKTRADAGGKWMTFLNLKDSGPGPFEMKVEGSNQLVISDVVVGEVWLASGQSNMALPVASVIDADREITESANSLLRQFVVTRNATTKVQDDTRGSWVIASPQTTGRFSAAGYFFIKKLNCELKVPVGMINSSWGGTPIEGWISMDGTDSVPDLKRVREQNYDIVDGYPARISGFITTLGAWIKDTRREDKPVADAAVYAGIDVSTEGWIPVKIPGEVIGAGLPQVGAVWLRTEITFPTKRSNSLDIALPIDGYDSVYWNGRLLKQVTYEDFDGAGTVRHDGAYRIPAADINDGKNVLAIRFYEPVRPAKIWDVPMLAWSTPVKGEWLAKAEYEFPPVDAAKIASAPRPPVKNLPRLEWVSGCLFNGMINPLRPYAISGVIWYQGEANAGNALRYRDTFPLLIADWRKQWGQGDFPFYFCQLANYMGKKSEPSESKWAELREAQSMTLKVPHTGQAVLIDIGEAGDIHPRDKQDVGERLACIALANDYGKSIPYSCPVCESMKIEQGRVVLGFSHADAGLVARPLPELFTVKSSANETAPLVRNSPGSELEGFAICGADKKWVWANAKIEGSAVIVWSDQVSAPVAVRYAWADNPTCNLYNGAGLPASPFRTDDVAPAVPVNAGISKPSTG
jgi:sialate O-acetylesterase